MSGEALISNLIGLGIGLAIAWGFHIRASRDLDKVLTILARFLEQFARQSLPKDHPVKVGFKRDKKGRIINASINIGLTEGAAAGDRWRARTDTKQNTE